MSPLSPSCTSNWAMAHGMFTIRHHLLLRPITSQQISHLRQGVFQSSRKFIFKTSISIGVLLAMTGYHQITNTPIKLDSELYPQIMDHKNQSELESTNSKLMNDESEIQSLLSVQKLSFGTITGICAGVFVKKGLTLLAFLFGGGFVFLQYLRSRSLIRINWKNWSDRYESRVRSSSENKKVEGKGIVMKFIDFLTKDFQYRSTFLVGFLFGLRIA